MALQVFDTNSIGTGVQIDLGTGDNLYVAAGVIIASTDANIAIAGFGTGRQLHIDGTVVSDDVCIGFAASQTTTYLGENSVLRSYGSAAIQFDGAGQTIETEGKVFGKFQGIYLSVGDGSDTLISNTGRISGGAEAIHINSEDFVTIENSGVIMSDGDGIYVSGTSAGVAITNSGTIKGGDGGIVNVSTGALTIVNTGIIRLGAQLGAQSDNYDGQAGRITGTLTAGTGDDTIKGGAYDERFEGDAGKDLLTGGAGADMFIYVGAGDSTLDAAGRDIISDFSHASGDIIDFSALSSGELDFVGKAHFSGTDEIRYQTIGKNTFVYVNLDADSTAELAIQLTGKIKFVEADFAV